VGTLEGEEVIDETLVKNVFFYVNDKDPKGVYADDVNLLDFAQKLDAVLSIEHRKKEHARCVAIIRQHDAKLADLLEKSV
jgi:hypothetical protein